MKMVSEPMGPDGSMALLMNEDCQGLKIFGALDDVDMGSEGSVEAGRDDRDEGPRRQRRLADDSNRFSLDNFLTFAVVRGDEDSASIEDLSFSVRVGGITDGMLSFKMKFDQPLKVSIGSEKDLMIATIVDGSFFASGETGMPIPPGTTIENILPKMLPGEEFVMVMEKTKETMEKTTNTVIIAQIIITLILSVSLKSMWNLYNVIQILAYIRFFTGWPAFMLELLMYLDNTVTMKTISDPIMEYGQSEFTIAE